MGEEVKKLEEAIVNGQTKEEPPAGALEAEKTKEAAAAPGGDENKEGADSNEPLLPPPVILGIDLHCTGCSNKITRCILRCKGVEGVEVDMAKNTVTVKGILNPYDICDHLRKRTMRNAIVISPPPPPPAVADVADVPKEEPVIIHSQVNEVTTVELLINMHCEACAQQLRKKILKMRAVQSAEANHNTGKLRVTGTMSTDSLIQYIHRRTGKLATVAPQPLPLEPTKEEELKEDGTKNPRESLEINKEKPHTEDSKDKKDTEERNKEEDIAKSEISASTDDNKAKTEVVGMDGFADEEMIKRMIYWPNLYKHFYNLQTDGEAVMSRVMPIVQPYPKPKMSWMTPVPPPTPSPMTLAHPIYHNYRYNMVERQLPPPQYFSDENPNACVIS